MTESDVAFVDCETTGLDPNRHAVWEVGLIVDDVEHHWFLPVNIAEADPFALEIGGFYERHPDYRAGGPTEDERCTQREDFCREFSQLTARRHLVGAVVSFDAERLAIVLRTYGWLPRWHYHLIDVEALAVGYLMGIDGEVGASALPWQSEEVSKLVGVDPGTFEKHTALGDARWAREIYQAIMGDT